MENLKILFISDSSRLNPILQSQGLPLLEHLAQKDFNCSFVSFEQDRNKTSKSNANRDKNYQNLINFYQVNLKSNKYIPKWLLYYLKGFYKILIIILKEKNNILHARSLPPAIIACFIKLFLFPRINLIYDNRGVFIDEMILTGQWKPKGIKVKIFRFLEKLVLQNVEQVVVVSEYFKKFLINNFENTIRDIESKIIVIPNRTFIKFNSNEEVLSKKDHEEIICIYSGSAAPWQNVPKLKIFIESSLQSNPRLNIRIFTYEKRIFEKNLGEVINSKRFLIDKIEPKEIYNNLIHANFGLLIRENNLVNNVSSPLKFGEYLAAGLPVIISEGIGDTEKIVNTFKVGVVIKNNDFQSALNNMIDLLNDEDIYSRCLMLARKSFDIKSSFEQYFSIYKKLSF